MSKIGKKPIAAPSGVTITVTGSVVKVKGAKGELSYSLPAGIQVVVEGQVVSVKRQGNDLQVRRCHGLVRAFVNNMIVGVSKGFEKRLEMIGVGYRAQASGKKITLNLGFSHPIEYLAPEGVTIQMDQENKNTIIITGVDRQKVGQVASDLRTFRPPEPYKGKGIKYIDEHIVRKAGKAAATAGSSGGAA
ncbi:MAG: 50S ribosomal protein L6 [Candidatus Peregrinibacteria bacterium]